ncbi:Beta-1-4-galactosyltransferase galt-1-like 2 [Homarus americanus]|uniref:Glycosyltransferase family 92 protein n=1 Tax=Homarus americanus TaxID=6706 RepID=A0A8J5JUW9_HOMAM|nr:Beta-1-4-galactosyltransferase galt-1-like 2 [Homarus americanus]
MVEAAWPPTPTCHFWYAHDDPVPVATKAIRMDYVQWQERVEGQWMPFLVTCRAGRNLRGIPRVVSLVAYACEPATNALRVLNQGFSAPYTKKGLALCHKFIFNPARDFSKRLVEWVEVARAWGVDEVMVYEGAAHPNVTKVLRYYQKEGYLKVMPWTSPGSQPSIPHLFNLFSNENVPYTDCLLRHIATHKYVAVWDVDEFMLPATHPSLPAMMDAAKARAESLGLHPTSYLARCSYYFDDLTEQPTNDLPEYLYSLRHVTRTVRLTPPAVFTKSIHDTSYALGLHAHFALVNLAGPVDRIHDLYHLYPGHEAHLAHYRSKCQGESQVECETDFRPYLTRDTTMWRHRQAISNAARRVLMKLNLILP